MQTQCNRLAENGNGSGHHGGAANGTGRADGNAHAHVFELLAESLEQYIKPQQSLDAEAVQAMVQSLVDERLARLSLPRPVEVKLPDGSAHKLDGLVHCQFDQVIGLVNEGHRNVLLSGPAGSGKTTLAYNLAQALKLDFGFLSLSAGVTETHLFGRVLPQADGSWQYQPSRFVEIYENGGVFLLDEIDAADANVMVAINAALANGLLANPNGRVHKRHPDTYIIAAANTWGRGADVQYVGRNQLDAATLDRFVLSTLRIGYDADLERQIVTGVKNGDELLMWVAGLRARIEQYRLRRIASTRLVAHAAAALRAGRSIDDVKGRFLVDWSDDEKAKVQ